MYERTAGGGSGSSASARSMGITSALDAVRNRVNSTLGEKPAPNMSLNSSAHHFSQPVKKSSTGEIAYYDPFVNSAVSAITGSDKFNLTKNALQSSSKSNPSGSGSYGGSGGSGGSAPTSAKEELHYYEAPLAEMYGFSPETAYQEALVNTSIRREMNDMRKAGLNPSVIYGSHNSSGSDSGIIPRQTSSDSGGGGGGGFRRRSGKSNSGKYLFSGGAYYGTMAAVGTVVSLATKNVGAGMAAAGLAGTAMKALNGIFKKK